ncbi:PHP domain-containing protein [Zophobihabitans entericus]|uniref:PHP domain-containing protein n=1 Tax=Zophobihabitans entericus TaxID=1635327 RepID=A0A6G9IBQ2_9GAMM|nr:PHP domain-containing protein [Zophobihabitans entericus]QIQ21665.1 PHP domain-containing protein [Zophobihabitans entericus]
MIYADLHIHTNHSDGVCEITDVLENARSKGLKTLAITDHDTTNHYPEIFKEGKRLGLNIIKGVEMSCYDFDVFKKVHIVGLGLNLETPNVDRLCSHTLACRDQYHRELILELHQHGYDICYEDAKKFSKYNIVFKMNIFQALKEKYPQEMTKERYKELFASKTSKETDLKMGYIPVAEGIASIIADGGVPILAHPCVYDNYDEIEKYVGFGLKGLEISHSKMKPIDYEKTQMYAEKYQLLKSGGSDFHDPALLKFGDFGLTQEQLEELAKAGNIKVYTS